MRTVIILGAARSGTKILRDTIAANPNAFKIPYDINYIWRQGCSPVDSDELELNCASDERKQRIRDSIFRLAKIKKPEAPRGSFIIEKTVSNTLRVPFVHSCFPDAYFVHIVRNGLDVVASAMQQWEAKPNVRYLLKKLRYFPTSQLRYAGWYARNNLKKGNGKKSLWGPRYAGIETDAQQKPLHIVCARQWAISVSRTLEGLIEVNAKEGLNVRSIKYDQFCLSADTYMKICSDLTLAPEHISDYWRKNVSNSSINQGARLLGNKMTKDVLDEFEKFPALRGYF